MDRIAQAFLKQQKVFIGFVTAGDPNLAVTKELVLAMEQAGAGIIELGIPFSDPVAEGPVIQRADERALKAGTTTDKIFDLVEELRRTSEIPLVFLTYANPIYTYGCERFFAKCEECGIDGVIVPDVPFEEREELLPYSKPHKIKIISLIAPTSKERIKMIASQAEGYVYLVSSLGVTGMRSKITTNIADMVAAVRQVTKIPVAVGFGISKPQQAQEMAAVSDGAIVGSAIVKIVEEYGEAAPQHVFKYVKEMAEATLMKSNFFSNVTESVPEICVTYG